MRDKSSISFFLVITFAFGHDAIDPDQDVDGAPLSTSISAAASGVTSTANFINDNVDADNIDEGINDNGDDPSTAQSSFYINSMNNQETKTVSCDDAVKKKHAGLNCSVQVNGYVQRLAEIIAGVDEFQARAFLNRLLEDRDRAEALRDQIVTSQDLLTKQTERCIKIADGLEVQGLCIGDATLGILSLLTVTDEKARKDGLEQNLQRLHMHMKREENLWNEANAETSSLGEALAAADENQRAIAGENADFGQESGAGSEGCDDSSSSYTFECLFPKISEDAAGIEAEETNTNLR